MADISLLISVKTDDVVKSIKVINKLKTDANLVFKSLKKGTDSYTKGLSEVRKSLVATRKPQLRLPEVYKWYCWMGQPVCSR